MRLKNPHYGAARHKKLSRERAVSFFPYHHVGKILYANPETSITIGHIRII